MSKLPDMRPSNLKKLLLKVNLENRHLDIVHQNKSLIEPRFALTFTEKYVTIYITIEKQTTKDYIMNNEYIKMNRETNTAASDKLITMCEEGSVGYENVVSMCMSYMSEDDIADMMDANEISDRFLTEDGEISTFS